MSPVRVLGMMAPTCPVTDLQMTIPYGHEEIISDDKAAESRDLWVCISAGRLFKMADPLPQQSVERHIVVDRTTLQSPPTPSPSSPSVGGDIVRLLQNLLEQNRMQHLEMVALVHDLIDAQKDNSDALRQRPVAAPSTTILPRSPIAYSSAEPEVPHYIPSFDVSDSLSMDVREETTADNTVKASATKLKELRKKNGNHGNPGESV